MAENLTNDASIKPDKDKKADQDNCSIKLSSVKIYSAPSITVIGNISDITNGMTAPSGTPMTTPP